MKQVIANEAAKAVPPVLVSIWAWFGDITITQAVGLVTIGYIVLQAAYLIWKWRREAKAVIRSKRSHP